MSTDEVLLQLEGIRQLKENIYVFYRKNFWKDDEILKKNLN